tara:strand:+ start:292 stop:702 length:411 start_codon:yes stop_codon:yes gene_type:complete
MALVLSIVAEAGFDGFSYNSGVNAEGGHPYWSRKARWTVKTAPRFSPKEFRHLLAYAARQGLVEAGDDTNRLGLGQLDAKPWTLRLTFEGYQFVQDHDQPLLHRWFQNIAENVPSIVISILAALISAYLLEKAGLM